MAGTSDEALEFMLRLPALAAPPGADTTMTMSGPDQIWFLVVAITCIAIPGIFLILRIYTKLSIVRSFEPADYFIFLAFVLIVVEVVMGWYMVKWGAGVHQWQVTFRQLFNQLYWMNTAEVIYCPLCFLVKMAILLQYLRLFAPTRQLNRVMWYGAWTTIVACFIFYTVFMFWTMFYCRPRQMIWNKFTPDGKCHDHSPIVISQGTFNMASDIVVLLLPTSSLWQLRVPRGRKIIITVLFATGLLACAASVMRIVFTIKIAPVLSMSDVSHNGLFIGLWTEAEAALGFIVACSLSLPKLFQAKRKHFDRALTFVSSNFSSLRGTVRSPSGKSTLTSKSAQTTSASSRQEPVSERKQPIFFEERELIAQRPQRINTARVVRDAYALPSPLEDTRYSQSIYSERWSTIITPVDNSQVPRCPDPVPKALNITHHSPPPAYVNDPSPFPGSFTAPSEGTEANAEGVSFTILNGVPATGQGYRLTQEELFVLQQFNFDSFRDSVDIERTADMAIHGPSK